MRMLRWSPRAKKDITRIRLWYKQEAGEEVSVRIVKDIRQATESLRSHPNLGHIEPELNSFPQSFRTYVLIPNYKIIYWIEDDMVKIATIFDCRQRPEKLMYILNTKTDWLCEPQVPYGNND